MIPVPPITKRDLCLILPSVFDSIARTNRPGKTLESDGTSLLRMTQNIPQKSRLGVSDRRDSIILGLRHLSTDLGIMYFLRASSTSEGVG